MGGEGEFGGKGDGVVGGEEGGGVVDGEALVGEEVGFVGGGERGEVREGDVFFSFVFVFFFRLGRFVCCVAMA